MQQQREKYVFVDQGTLAVIMGVNRSTINRYQKLGMPYINGSKGMPSSYDIGICANWCAGHDFSTSRRIGMNGLQKVLWGMAWGGGDLSLNVWKARILRDPERLHASRDDLMLAIGVLSGADLLPW